MQKSRTSYHTSLKYLAKHDLLPDQYRQKIHRSLICKWKQEPDDKYVGYEINAIAEEQMQMHQKFAYDLPAQKLFKAYQMVIDAWKTVLKIPEMGYKYLRKSKAKVVDTIQQVAPAIGKDKALELFHISKSTFHTWLLDVNRKCFVSYFQACSRVYPNQLTKDEVLKMKSYLQDEQFKHWPVMSIAYHALRKGILNVSVKTWYKYQKLLDVKRPVPKSKRKKAKQGIRANFANGIWHLDVSKWITQSGKPYYIYMLVDNFSRFILSHRVSAKLCAELTLETIKEAYSKIEEPTNVNLIVDGGSENNNQTVREYLAQPAVNIEKQVAMLNINFSNSMIESVFKLLKYRYLYLKELEKEEALSKELDFAVKDYNDIRLHGSLKGLTPREVQNGSGIEMLQFKNQLEQGRKQRLEENRRNVCNGCE